MASLSVGDIFRARMWCTAGDQAAVNTIHGEVLSVTSAPVTDQDIANYLDAQLGPLYLPILSNLASYDGCQVQVITTPPFTSQKTANTHTAVGTAGAIGLPRQTSGLIRFQTDFSGKQYRGRWYLPFPSSSSDTGDGEVNPTYETNLANITGFFASTNFIPGVGVAAIAVAWVLIHSVPKKLPPAPTRTTQITSYSISSKWATQRKRGSFGRQNLSPV
jgi:hypothetical protein